MTDNYKFHHYMGEFADASAVLSFIRSNKWDTVGDGTGNPQSGMTYFNTTSNEYDLYVNSAWNDVHLGHDKIYEGNSYVEVVDAGTGSVVVNIDGTNVVTIDDNGLNLPDNSRVLLGNSGDAFFTWVEDNQTFPVPIIYIPYNTPLILTSTARWGFNFEAANPGSPTLLIHSGAEDATQWFRLRHNETDAYFEAGAGTTRYRFTGIPVRCSVGFDAFHGTYASVNTTTTGFSVTNTNPAGRAELFFSNDAGYRGGFTVHGTASSGSWGSWYVNRLNVYSFSSAAGVGIVADGASQTISFSAGSYNLRQIVIYAATNRVEIGYGGTAGHSPLLYVNGVSEFDDIIYSDSVILNSNGSASDPSYSFTSTTDAGMWWDSGNTRLTISTNTASEPIYIDSAHTVDVHGNSLVFQSLGDAVQSGDVFLEARGSATVGDETALYIRAYKNGSSQNAVVYVNAETSINIATTASGGFTYDEDVNVGTDSDSSARVVTIGESDLTANRGSTAILQGRTVQISAQAKDVSSGNQVVSVVATGAAGHAGTLSVYVEAAQSGGSGDAKVFVDADTELNIGTSNGGDSAINIGSSSTSLARQIVIGEMSLSGRGADVDILGVDCRMFASGIAGTARNVLAGVFSSSASTTNDALVVIYGESTGGQAGLVYVDSTTSVNIGTSDIGAYDGNVNIGTSSTSSARTVIIGEQGARGTTLGLKSDETTLTFDSYVSFENQIYVPKTGAELETLLQNVVPLTIHLLPDVVYDLTAEPVTTGDVKSVIGPGTIRFNTDSATNYLNCAYAFAATDVVFSTQPTRSSVPAVASAGFIRFTSNSSNSRLSNCAFDVYCGGEGGVSYNTIYINGNKVTIENCLFITGSDGPSGSLVKIDSVDYARIVGNRCYIDSGNSWPGITCLYSVCAIAAEKCQISGNVFEAGDQTSKSNSSCQIYLNTSTKNFAITENEFINNFGSTNEFIYMAEATSSVFHGHRICNNCFTADRTSGGDYDWASNNHLVLLDHGNVTFVGNTMDGTNIANDNSYTGSFVYLGSEADLCMINGNTLNGNASSQRGIWVGGKSGEGNNPARPNITGNTIGGFNPSGTGYGYGILVDNPDGDTDSADGGVIMGNTIIVASGETCISGKITAGSGANPQYWVIVGNTVYTGTTKIDVTSFDYSTILGNADDTTSFQGSTTGSNTNNQYGTSNTAEATGANH